MAPSTPRGIAINAAKPVISSVPMTAGPMPPKVVGRTFAGIVLLERNLQLMTPAPLLITV